MPRCHFYARQSNVSLIISPAVGRTLDLPNQCSFIQANINKVERRLGLCEPESKFMKKTWVINAAIIHKGPAHVSNVDQNVAENFERRWQARTKTRYREKQSLRRLLTTFAALLDKAIIELHGS